MPRPVHFEIHAESPERAVRFYSELFGWTFQKWEGGAMAYWLITTGEDGPGINGGLLQRMGPTPAPDQAAPVVAWVGTVDVEDVDAYVAKAVNLGGVVALAKMPIPGMGWLAYCKDPESNIFGLMQNDPGAA